MVCLEMMDMISLELVIIEVVLNQWYPMFIDGNGNVTFDGVVSAKAFSINGKDLTGADLKEGAEGLAGSTGKDGTDGTDGKAGSSNAHLGLIMDGSVTLNDSENQVFKKTGSNGWNAQVRSSDWIQLWMCFEFYC